MVSTRSRSNLSEAAATAPAEKDKPTPSSPKRRVKSKEDLPPQQPKEERGVRSGVSPPLSNITLNNFIHVLSVIAFLFFAWYAYRAATAAVATVKGTVSSATKSPLLSLLRFGGREAAHGRGGGEPRGDVEQRIEDLAKALGIPSPELSKAIAGAVKEYVPPASLSSVAKEAKKTGSSQVVEELTGEGGAQGGAGGVAGALGSMIGNDDVPGDW